MAVNDQFEKDLTRIKVAVWEELKGQPEAAKKKAFAAKQKAYLRKNAGRKRWLVTYRDASGYQHKARYDTELEAERFDAEQRVTPAQRLAEEAKTLTVAAMVESFLVFKQGLAAKTLEAYRYDADHVIAAFGGDLARTLDPERIQTWAWRDGYSASVRERGLKLLRASYQLAVLRSLVPIDPTRDPRVTYPKPEKSLRRSLTLEQLERLADAAGPYRALIWFMGTTGLRIGEVAGLRVGDLRPSIKPERNHVKVERQRQVSDVSLPKNRETRDVPVAPLVMAMLDFSRGPQEWLFLSPQGRPMDVHNWRTRVFHPATKAAGINTPEWKMVPHELRHTAATLAIRSGADLKQVQNMLGHKNGNMTFNLYGKLMQKDTVAASMENLIHGFLGDHVDVEVEEFDAALSAQDEAAA